MNTTINASTVKQGKEEVVSGVVSMNGGLIGTITRVIVVGYTEDTSPKKIASKISKHFEDLNDESVEDSINRIKSNIAKKNPEVKETYVMKVVNKLKELLSGKDENAENVLDATASDAEEISDEEIEVTKIPKIINIEKEAAKKDEQVRKEVEVMSTSSTSKVKDTFAERTGISTFFSNLAFKIKTF